MKHVSDVCYHKTFRDIYAKRNSCLRELFRSSGMPLRVHEQNLSTPTYRLLGAFPVIGDK